MPRTAYLASLGIAFLGVSALPPKAALADEKPRCGGEGVLVERLSAHYDAANNAIVTEMELCDDVSDTTRYRVHYALSAPSEGLECVDPSDAMTMRFLGHTMGYGESEVEDDNLVRFILPVDLLDPDLVDDDEVFYWGFAHFRDAPDRIPTTDGSDDCNEPQNENEVLAVTLSEEPEQVACDGGPCSVFVTSTFHTGALGGLEGADQSCQELADAAELPGTYKAWLSDSTGSPSTRFTRSSLPYIRVDGALVANDWTDLTTCDAGICLQNSISLEESGDELLTGDDDVWTNTTTSGTAAGEEHCNNWSETAGTGSHGDYVTNGPGWTARGTAPCGSRGPALYCFQQ